MEERAQAGNRTPPSANGPCLGRSLCHGAFTIINGIATGKGGACSVDLRLLARFEVTDRPGFFEFSALGPGTNGGIDDRLALACARRLFEIAEASEMLGARVETVSEIPCSRGLKSSSAAANAIVLAGAEALGVGMEPMTAVRLGVECARDADVTLTGAFDDAVATMLGGAVLTDNETMEVLKRTEVPEGLEVLFLVPDRKIEKASLTRDKFAPARGDVDHAFELAMTGRLDEAITLNGRAYAPLLGVDTAPVEAALAAGAWAAGMSGTGPAIAVICDGGVAEDVKAALAPYQMRTIPARPNKTPARLLTDEEYGMLRGAVLGGGIPG